MISYEDILMNSHSIHNFLIIGSMLAIRPSRLNAYLTRCKRLYGGGICDSGSRNKGDSDKNKEDIPPCGPCRPSECNPSAPTIYDCRKYGHNLPRDSVRPYFETLPHFPTGIFRSTAGEILGRGANKSTYYQNPEYFSYHHMSFYDLHMLLRCYRNPSAKTGRKK